MHRYLKAGAMLAVGLSFISISAHAFTIRQHASACYPAKRMGFDNSALTNVRADTAGLNNGNTSSTGWNIVCPIPNGDSYTGLTSITVHTVGGATARTYTGSGTNVVFGTAVSGTTISLPVPTTMDVQHPAGVIVTLPANSTLIGITVSGPG